MGNGPDAAGRLESRLDRRRARARTPGRPTVFFAGANKITQTAGPPQLDPRSVLLRRKFTLRPAIRRARAYVSGTGYHEFHCNGRKVNDRVLAPSKAITANGSYTTPTTSPRCCPSGPNALGVMLGNGWFNPPLRWWEPYRMQ